jgi:4-hydroxy-tetrahydrodipicolinate synthase
MTRRLGIASAVESNRLSSASTSEAATLRGAVTDRAAWRRILADVAVVTVTPYAGRHLETIDHDGLERNLGHLSRGGVRLLVAGGNTGEFAALADAEVVDVVGAHARLAQGRATVIAGVGHRLERAVELGRASIEAGADGLMVHHPIHPYASEAGLVTYYTSLAEALPGVPLILYVRGPQLTPASVRRLATVESIVGVKMGQADPERFATLVAAAPDLAWVCGLAEGWAVRFWEAGAIGFTSGFANVAPDRSLEVLAALVAGDLPRAERLVSRLQPIEQLRAGRGEANNVAVIKAAMDLVGLVGGGLRPPLSELNQEDHAELVRILRTMGLRA